MIRISTIFLVLFTTTAAQAVESNMRLLVHGTHVRVPDSRTGVAGWLIAPNVSDSPSTWLGVAGPRIDGSGWNLELMAGAVISAGDATPLVDARLELLPELLGTPVYLFVNPEWVDPGGDNTLYLFGQINYVLPSGIALLGIETENEVRTGSNAFSAGPQLVIPLGQMALVSAYQFRRGRDQVWLRCVVNL